MSYFSRDKKWIEAKKVIGDINWLEIISYYRMINGSNVFVYSIINKEQKLIVDILDDHRVILVNKHSEIELEDYNTVLSSRKRFCYSHKYKEKELEFNGRKINIKLEDLSGREE